MEKQPSGWQWKVLGNPDRILLGRIELQEFTRPIGGVPEIRIEGYLGVLPIAYYMVRECKYY